MNINHVVITGHLTRDPESFADGKVVKLGVAVNGREKKGDQWEDRPDYFEVTCFGRIAENVKQYLAKGSAVAIDGRLRQDRWTNDSGDNRSKVIVIANVVQFLDGKPDGSSNGGERFTPQSDVPANATAADDDIPF